MNTHNVISLPVAVDLAGKEHQCVKLTATGINLAGVTDRIIGTLLRANTKRDDGGSVVGMAADVFLSVGNGQHFATIGNNTAIALNDDLERGTTAGTLVKHVSGKVVAIAAQAVAINSSGGIIQVIMLPNSDLGFEPVTPTQDPLVDNTTGTASTTLAAVTAASAAVTDTTAASLTSVNAALTSIKNSLATLAAENAKIKADFIALNTALEGA